MNRSIVVSFVATLIALWINLADAQQTKKAPRIGCVFGASASSVAARTEAFRRGLRELGYV